MVLEQALELRIEILVAFDAPEVVALRHPLEAEDGNGDRQGPVAQDRLADVLSWTDQAAFRAELGIELAQHGAEQLAMFFFLVGKVAQRLRAERLRGRAVSG